MKSASVTGRFALIALIFMACLSIYLLVGMPVSLQSFGEKLAMAGAAICIVFLRIYRTSVFDVEAIPLEKLSKNSLNKINLLRFIKYTSLAASSICLTCFFISVIYRIELINISPIVFGIVGFILIGVREAVSAQLAGPEFAVRKK